MTPARAATVKKVYGEALRLLATPQGWTQGAAARDRDNYVVSAVASEAVRFSLLGALRRARFNLDLPLSDYTCASAFMSKFAQGPLGSEATFNLVVVNDHSSHEEVLALVHRTINELNADQETQHASV